MMSKRFIPIFLFIGLLVGGSYYYLCTIKQVCDCEFFNLKSDASDVTDSTNQILSPLSFRLNSAEPVLGIGFTEMRDGLLARLGNQDTLVINAVYYDGETNGENLASERAENVKSLFTDHFDVSRLQTQIRHDGMSTADKNSSLEAIQFTVVSNELDDVSGNTSAVNVDTDATAPLSGFTTPVDQVVIYFPKGSIRKHVTPEISRDIDNIVSQMKSNSSLSLSVTGHTDNEGNEDENLQLGRVRAWVIKKMIWDKGVDPTRIFTSSKGESIPLNQKDTEVDRAYNRRVEVILMN